MKVSRALCFCNAFKCLEFHVFRFKVFSVFNVFRLWVVRVLKFVLKFVRFSGFGFNVFKA